MGNQITATVPVVNSASGTDGMEADERPHDEARKEDATGSRHAGEWGSNNGCSDGKDDESDGWYEACGEMAEP